MAVCALIYWFLNPYFTNGLKGISLYISLALGIAIVTLSYDGTQLLVSRRAGVQGVIRVFPIAILIAIVCVALSRAIQFRPGLIFGFVGAYTAVTSSQMVLKSEEEKDVKQRAVAILLGIGVVLIISLTAFFLRGLLYETAWREGDAWRYLVEDILVAAFAIGLEGLVFSLVPMDFLDGKRVFTWNRRVWLIAVLLTTFIFYHIIINPDDKLADAVKDAKKYVMIALVILFLIISLGMWLYFKGRRKALPKDKVPTPALSDTDEVPRAADTATQVPPENVAMQENTEILTSQRVEMVDKMAGAVEPGPIPPESTKKPEQLAEEPPSSPGSDLPNGQEKPQAS